MNMIHDEELRQLFQAESEEHLQNLETGLLHLEHHPDDKDKLIELQRELHNLKGSARMLGVSDIENISHHMEDVLKAISNGDMVLTHELVDKLEIALDALRNLAIEALTGAPAEVSIAEILTTLSTISIKLPDNLETRIENIQLKQPTEILTVAPKTDIQPEVHIEPHVLDTHHETIRIDPKKLDILITNAGELVVAKGHVERWLVRIDELIATWEETTREIKTSLTANYSNNYIERMEHKLYPLRRTAFENSTVLSRITQSLEDNIRALRMLPLDRVFQLFPRTVRDMARTLSKEVQLIIHGGDTTVDKQLIELLKDPLMHLVRNAIHHGIESPTERVEKGKPLEAKLILSAKRTAVYVVIKVIDDGRGLDMEAIKNTAMERGLNTKEELNTMSEQNLRELIFVSGFSTNKIVDDISGRGVGLDVVRTNVERLKGTLTVQSVMNQGCKFVIKLPVTLATTRVFLVNIAERRYAIPVEFARIVRYVYRKEIFLVQDQETINWHGEAISMVWLEDLLDLPTGKRPNKTTSADYKQPCVIIEAGDAHLGIFVDEIVEEREIVLKPTGHLLNRVRNVSGITILGSGDICVVLNPLDLVRTAQKKAKSSTVSWKISEQLPVATTETTIKQKKPLILLAEDSITTRTQEKRILESAGYEVITAVDGLAAFNILATRPFDALVSDVEMPNMDGLTLAEKVRENNDYEHLPIILVTSLATEADRKRGMDVGADAYIVKSAFNQQMLLDTLSRLV